MTHGHSGSSFNASYYPPHYGGAARPAVPFRQPVRHTPTHQPAVVHNHYFPRVDDHVKQYNSRGWIIVVSWIMAFAWAPLALGLNIWTHGAEPLSLMFIAAVAGPLFLIVQVILNIFLLALPQQHKANLLVTWLGMLAWWAGGFLTVLPVSSVEASDERLETLDQKQGMDAATLLVDMFNVSYSGLALAIGGVAALIIGLTLAIREADENSRSLLSHAGIVAPHRSRLMR